MEFKSQICTSRSQSELLLSLGLKKETADMAIPYPHFEKFIAIPMEHCLNPEHCIPAWSLHRLMEIMPKNIGCYEQFVSCYKNDVMYINDDGYSFFNRTNNDNLYDGIIDCIKWAIVNRYINPQFLEGKQ